VTGDSYAPGSFSTRTSIWDMATGAHLVDLEQFSVWQNGRQLQSPDHNFWGVTFDPADSDHFYATLGTGGHTYLVSAHLSAKKADILRDGVECPSVSPDGTRIAYKKRVKDLPKDAPWRLYVLDLRTMHETPLTEPRSVDDQAVWRDNHTLVYALPGDYGADLYTIPADGTGKPERISMAAVSPAYLTQ
jgi:Tol biopolymer transport system component